MIGKREIQLTVSQNYGIISLNFLQIFNRLNVLASSHIYEIDSFFDAIWKDLLT